MIPMRLIPLACKTALWLILLLAPLTASAEWHKDYEAAMELIKKNQYPAAIPLLQSALRQKSNEGANIKFYGMKFGDYFPHYYLGRAYFYQKDYSSALSEFEKSEEQGEIQKKRDLFGGLKDLKSIAGAQMAMANQPKNPPPAPTETVVTTPPAQQQPPPAETRAETPEQKVEPALKPQPVPEQPAKVVDVSKQLEPVKKETPPLTESITPQKEETTREKARKIAKDGARRYFAGDYDGAIASFTQALGVDSSDSAAQFLLGCSFAAKYLLSGSQDRRLFEQASAAFQKAKRANIAGPMLRNPYISPAILEIYQKSGA